MKGRRLLRALVFLGPLLVWLAFLLAAATPLGGYANSWDLIWRALNVIEPGHSKIGDYGVSLYQLNQAFRKLAHVALYAGLTALCVRACQWGDWRLRLRTVLATLLLACLFMGGESVVRLRSVGRHVRASQFAFNAFGVALVLGVTYSYFGLKAIERRLRDEDRAGSAAGDPATLETDPPTDET